MMEGSIHSDASLLVHSLAHSIGSWKRQYLMLGERLAGLRIFQSNLAPHHPDFLLSREVVDALLPFITLYKAGNSSSGDFTAALGQCVVLEARAKEQPGGDEAGRVYGALHSLVNILSVLRNTSASIAKLLDSSRSHDFDGHVDDHWKQLKTIAAATAEAELTFELLSRIETLLNDLMRFLPPPAASAAVKYSVSKTVGNRIYLLVVEDDGAWLPDVERMVKELASAYSAPSREVQVGVARTYEDAQGLLRVLTASQDAPWSVIMILDIGLPRDAGELEKIEKYSTTVGRRWGRELLRFARGYKQRYDVIVFTSVTSYPEDHRAALESGVAPSDFILKGPGAIRELEQSIHRIMAPQRAPRLEILTHIGQRVRLNGLEIELDPGPFRTLCVLARNRRRGLSIEEIADLLEQSYPGEYRRGADLDDAWERALGSAASEGLTPGSAEFTRRANEILRELNAPINALEAWRGALRSQGKDGEGKDRNRKTLSAFYDNCTAYVDGLPWRWFCGFAELPETPPTNWGECLLTRAYRVASRELTASQLRPDSFEPESVHDHVYHIRTRLYSATHLDPARNVLVTEDSEEGFRYRVVADVVFIAGNDGRRHQAEPLGEDEPCKVLVVENDRAWAEQIEATLRSGWYAVGQAATVLDAVRQAEKFRPHILCLDLHLPFDDEELKKWEEGESGGDRTGGVKVLQEVQAFNPLIKAVVLSSFVNDDEIRVQATRAGVDVHDVVSKTQRAGSWEAEFLRAVWKNEQEIRRGVLLAATDDDLPFISIKLEDHGPRSRGARVYSAGGDRWVPLREKEFSLLNIFREIGYRPVSRDELMERIYGDEWPDKHEAFDNVLKRLRQAIVQNGLGVTAGQARKIGTTIISHSSGTYLLKCKVL